MRARNSLRPSDLSLTVRQGSDRGWDSAGVGVPGSGCPGITRERDLKPVRTCASTSRGSRRDLREPGGATPPGHSTSVVRHRRPPSLLTMIQATRCDAASEAVDLQRDRINAPHTVDLFSARRRPAGQRLPGLGWEALGERPHRLGLAVGSGDGARTTGRAVALRHRERRRGCPNFLCTEFWHPTATEFTSLRPHLHSHGNHYRFFE
jgi:hypothetical protein